MQPEGPFSLPAPRCGCPHLLDVSMFWNPVGGVQQVINIKRTHLAAQGWRHSLMAPGAHGAGQIDCGGWPVPGSGGYRFVTDRAGAARRIEAARPDIIEAADPYTLGWAVLDAATRLKVPAVAFCHSNLPAVAARLAGGVRPSRHGRWAAGWARRYLQRLYERYDLVLAPSRWMTQHLHEWGLPQARHQPLGVDCAVFHPRPHDPAARSSLRQALALAPDTLLLVYVGRFGPEKNLDVLSAAVQRLGPGHVLLAVGAGPCPPLGDRVRVLPAERDRARLARLLAGCDAFVHAGDQETFGLAVLEAMACGVPVVVAQAGGLGELAQGAGRTVPGRHPAAWADAMVATLASTDPHLAAAALVRARAHAWPAVLAQWSGLYHRALHRHAPPQIAAPLVPAGAGSRKIVGPAQARPWGLS